MGRYFRHRRTWSHGRAIRERGLHVAAVDVADDKLALARQLGAEVTANAKTQDAAAKIRKEIGGAHGVLVTAFSTTAFRQAISMLRRGGTCSLVGLPPGEFPLPIFDAVLNGLTIRGSIVGTRNDIAEALAFAAEGKVKAHYQLESLENINSLFDRMKKGDRRTYRNNHGIDRAVNRWVCDRRYPGTCFRSRPGADQSARMAPEKIGGCIWQAKSAI